ncbi:MAG: hypothetical protein ABFD69_08200 [Candidatus Sumerlaeia bacterium]
MDWQVVLTTLMIVGAGVYLAARLWARRRQAEAGAPAGCPEGCCGCPHLRPEHDGGGGCREARQSPARADRG